MRSRNFKYANGHTSGTYTTTSTSFADIDTSLLVVTIEAQAGDVLDIDLLSASFFTTINPSDVILQYTLGGIVTTTTGTAAPIAWTINTAGVLYPSANLRFMETVTAPMVASGAVIVRPQWATGASMSASLKADTARTPRLVVQNLGPQQPF